eukprot:3738334-Amphidinium_carterae.2
MPTLLEKLITKGSMLEPTTWYGSQAGKRTNDFSEQVTSQLAMSRVGLQPPSVPARISFQCACFV